MSEPRRFRIAAEVDRLADVRAFVRDIVTELGGSRRTTEDLVQAVDEAACNVMLHGYDGKGGEIELEAELRDGQIEITILDRAPAFDPTAAPPATVSDASFGTSSDGPGRRRRPGTAGVGLHLARTMTDAVRHHVRPGGGNELTLVRSIDGTTSEEG